MIKYTGIADTSERLIGLLQKELVPDVLKNESDIGLRSPEEHGDVSLGLFLYDIQECEELHQRGMLNTHVNRQMYPPVYLNLFYMITAYSAGDLKFRMAQEERILGGVVQIFHNNTLIPAGEGQENGGMDLHIQLLRISTEEKSRIWNFQGVPYKLSLFYKVSPVMIESGRERAVSRVTQTDITISPILDARKGR
ncbi:MAG: DUF4255 domain-containing protein [Lachnospiraceae bacterium]|nr:DUF4255 domain-containing protein [Lachnospiraceae bacterium]